MSDERPKLIRFEASIIESTHSGWMLQTAAGVAIFPTAAEALFALHKELEWEATCGRSTITILTWETRTRIGAMVARALAGSTKSTRKQRRA